MLTSCQPQNVTSGQYDRYYDGSKCSCSQLNSKMWKHDFDIFLNSSKYLIKFKVMEPGMAGLSSKNLLSRKFETYKLKQFPHVWS